MSNEPEHKPNCEGMDPLIFDIPEFAPTAIDACNDCKVRAWCLKQVDPAKNYYDGVAGGHQWLDGRILHRWSDPDKDQIVQLYLGSKRRKANMPVNSPRVRDFMVGKIGWHKLSIAERQEAVRRMAAQGTPQELAAKYTNLDPIQVAGIYKTTIKRTGQSNK